VIFVTVGTNEARFDRLLRALDGLALEERLVVQCGASAIRPAGAECVEFLPYEELVERVREARLVVTHAGVGSVLVVLSEGKRPLVVPRLHRHGEAVDDHQLAFARHLESAGLVSVVEELAELPAALAADAAPAPVVGGGHELADDLRRYVVELIGEPVA